MSAEVLVTGCYRSGTTLLEKLLHAHPSSCVASQPFPVLYAYVKGMFDEKRGLQRRYPLSHRFLEGSNSDADFAAFLDHQKLTDDNLDAIFEQLSQHTEGHWTPEIIGSRSTIRPGTFLEVYRQLMQAVVRLLPKTGAHVIGSKEILAEEYVPYLLGKGFFVIIILRDPRDMIASLNFSERDNATGEDRPVLYSIRIWRKSVATALAFDGHPRFRWLRYEDLVMQPWPVMTGLADFLQLPAYPENALSGRLRDQRGRDWGGNSSFRGQAGVSQESAGRYRNILPPAVQSMIEVVAAPEMNLLGYEAARPDTAALTHYRDPFTRIHAKFPSSYSSDAGRVRNELERLERLTSPSALSAEEAGRWFVYPRAYTRLRQAARPRGTPSPPAA